MYDFLCAKMNAREQYFAAAAHQVEAKALAAFGGVANEIDELQADAQQVYTANAHLAARFTTNALPSAPQLPALPASQPAPIQRPELQLPLSALSAERWTHAIRGFTKEECGAMSDKLFNAPSDAKRTPEWDHLVRLLNERFNQIDTDVVDGMRDMDVA